MVKLYPTLIANSVSKNIIPGILKSIERYAMIYRMGDIMKQARKDLGVEAVYRKVGSKTKIVVKETEDQLINFLAKEFLAEAGPGPRDRYPGSGTKGQPPQSQADQEAELAWAQRMAAAQERGRQRARPSTADEVEKARLIAAATDAVRRGNEPSDAERAAAEEVISAARERGRQTAQPSDAERAAAEFVIAQARERGRRAGGPSAEETEDEAYAREKGRQRAMPASAANASVGIGPYDMTSLMLEPSWMKIDMETPDGAKHSGVIGVKAVPVAVKSDANLAHLIMWDKQIGKLMTLIIRMGRPIEGIFYRAWRSTIGKFFGAAAISGNPFKDIVMKRTIIGTKGTDDVFLVLNQADLPPDFTHRASQIQKLFKLSWESFCIADDVNRRVAFCMKHFRGMCSIVPYSMLYQTLGQARVFEDMEDLRRTSGNLFKSNKNLKKVLGEGMAQQKLQEFSADLIPQANVKTERDVQLLQEIELLDENFASFIKKVSNKPREMITRAMKGTLDGPEVGPDRLAKLGMKVNPNFKKAYDLAVKVIENSLSDIKGTTIAKWAALLVVIKALPGRSKDLIPATREQLVKMIPIIRKALRKITSKSSYKMKPPPSHWPEVFIGSVVLLSFTTVAFKLYQGAMAMGAGKVVGMAAGAVWDILKGVFKSLKWLIQQANDDPETAKEATRSFLKDFQEGMEGLADTWIILSFSIVGIIATYKLIKGRVTGK